MFEIIDEQVFDGYKKILRVSVNSGSANLEIQTPNGWEIEKTFSESGTFQFKGNFSNPYRMTLSGGAKAYLIEV